MKLVALLKPKRRFEIFNFFDQRENEKCNLEGNQNSSRLKPMYQEWPTTASSCYLLLVVVTVERKFAISSQFLISSLLCQRKREKREKKGKKEFDTYQ